MDASKEQEIRNWNLSPLQNRIVEVALSERPDNYLYRCRDIVEKIDHSFPKDDSKQEVEAFLWDLWEFLIRLGQSLPNSRKASLTRMVAQLCLKTTARITIWGTEYSLWEDLPLFGPCMRDAWIGLCSSVIDLELYANEGLRILDPTLEPDLRDDEEELARWRNLNFFAASLFGHGVTDWENLALWQLRTGLEEPGEFVKTSVLVASEWIEEAGYRIYRLCRAETILDDEATIRAYACGPAFSGRPGFSRDRWAFWRTRLESAVRSPALADVSVALKRPLRLMSIYEQSMS
ncbi:Nn.00g111740.m01.CDS01 [Neocucurbitaria sp. VM-36]